MSSSNFRNSLQVVFVSHGFEVFVWRVRCGMSVVSVRPTFQALVVASGNPLLTSLGAGARGLFCVVAVADLVSLPRVIFLVLQATNMFTEDMADNKNYGKARM